MSQPIFYWNEKLGKTQAHKLVFEFQITAAKTVAPKPLGQPVLTTFDALASQSVIDTFLGTTNEFLLAQFDATSMGTDAFGMLVNLGGSLGQAASGVVMHASVFSGTYNATTVNANAIAGSLTASTLETAFAVGANGNLGVKLVAAGLDALTSGIIRVECQVVFK